MQFGILGPVQVSDGSTTVRLGARNLRVVLAVLLSQRNSPVSDTALTEALWSHTPPKTAAKNLHVLIHQLRRLLGDTRITRHPHGYALTVEDGELDADLFERTAAEAENLVGIGDPGRARAGFTKAMALWRGSVFEDVADVPALQETIARFGELRLHVIEENAAAGLTLGGHRSAIGELSALLSAHPLRERLRGLLMVALYRSDRQAEALQVFLDGRRTLDEKLGVEPGALLRQLHLAILRGSDPGLALTPERRPANMSGRRFLPFDVPDFTGREADIEKVLSILRRGAPVVIDGMAGIGKTSVAVRIARRATPDFSDGQLFCDLHGYTPGRSPSPSEAALATLLVQSGIPAGQLPEGLDNRAALWRAQTSDRKLLVLLDNAENADQVRPLLPGSSSVAVIVTSRRRLSALDGAVSVSLDVLPDADAGALFAAVAGRPDAGVVALCGNLPLAIRIAAARLAHRPQWNARLLAERLGVEHRRLAELQVPGRDVAAAFALSYRDLSQAQQRMFRLLGVHPGNDISVAAAASLADVAEAEAERLLEDLLDAHLLRQSAHGHYSLHDLLAEHARDTVHGEEADPALRRLLDYYRDGAGDDWHAAERDNLRAVTEHAERLRHDDHAWRIADHAAAYLRERGHRDDNIAIAEAGLCAARRLDDPAAVQTSLGHLATAYWETGRIGSAITVNQQRLRLARDRGDRTTEIAALSVSGVLLMMTGRFAESTAANQDALALTDETGDRGQAGRIWNNLSATQEALGRLHDALASAQRSESLRAATDDRHGLIQTRSHLALVLARLGKHSEALDIGAWAVREAVETQYLFGEAWSRIDFAEVLLLTDRVEEAREHAGRACVILSRLNHPLLLTMAANSLGAAWLAQGDAVQAASQHRLARDTAARVGYRLQEARALEGLGRAHTAMGDHTAAHDYLGQASAHRIAMGLASEQVPPPAH